MSSSESTCGRSSTWNQDRSGADHFRSPAGAAVAFGSMPTRAQPVKPPASGAAAGLLPELPVSGSSTPSVRVAAKVPAWAAMYAAPLPVDDRKSASHWTIIAASLRSPSCEFCVGDGSSIGWCAITTTLRIALFVAASSNCLRRSRI